MENHRNEEEKAVTTNKHGIDVLQDPALNKSTAFTEAEKQTLGIVGLVPDVRDPGPTIEPTARPTGD